MNPSSWHFFVFSIFEKTNAKLSDHKSWSMYYNNIVYALVSPCMVLYYNMRFSFIWGIKCYNGNDGILSVGLIIINILMPLLWWYTTELLFISFPPFNFYKLINSKHNANSNFKLANHNNILAVNRSVEWRK